VPLPCPLPEVGDEVLLTVRWFNRRASWYAPARHLVAWDQVELRGRRSPSIPAPPSPADGATEGAIEALDRLLVRPIELCIFRAPVDNDGYKLMPELAERLKVGGQALTRWKAAGVDQLPAEELVDHEMSMVAGPGGRTVECHHRVVVADHLADLARVGISFSLPGRFDRIDWYGRGPHENYPDRNRSALIGRWSAPPDDEPYLVPQEFGLRTDTRWLELVASASSERVRIQVVHPLALHFSATRYRVEDLYVARNQADLRPRKELVVHLDVAHRGLGTASCGPDVLDLYKLPAGEYRFAYRIEVGRSRTSP
jgi:beta-galactosidase